MLKIQNNTLQDGEKLDNLPANTNNVLATKQDKETGKGLSTNDFSNTDKAKLDGLSNYTLPTASDSVLGGVKVDGTTITIIDGVISSSGGGGGSGDMLKSENLSGLSNYATARQNLGLDTTANQTDSTDKRFMSDAQESKLDGIDMSLKLDKALTNLSGIDLNTITDNGFYCANTTCTNLPETGVKTRLRVNKDPSNPNLSMQEALTTTTLVSYVRTTANGGTSWTSWTRIKATDETKEPLKGADDNYVTDAQLTVISNTSGTNTGDNAVNSLYSGLATSKQDTLVSGTSIKTINGTSLLGSGNIVISGGSGATKRILTVGGTIGATGTNVGPNLTIDGTYTISQVNMWYGTAGNGTLTVDINKNGTTLFSSVKPTITTTNQSSINTGTLTTTSLASGDVLTIDIDAVPGTPGTDLYVEIIYS